MLLRRRGTSESSRMAVNKVDEGFGSVQEYEALMSILPPWLDGLPLAAKAWTDLRYVK